MLIFLESKIMKSLCCEFEENNSERPVDALALEKGESLTDSVSDNLKSRDAI